MTTKYHLNLIHGKFSPSSAGEMLFSLIRSKIHYHEMELFSNEERFSKDLSNSKIRIGELKNAAASLKEFIDDAKTQDQKMQINGYIEITLLDEQG